MKMKNRKVTIFVLVIMLFFEWHEFRTERVDVSQRVHELTTRFRVVTPGSSASLPGNNDRHARISLQSGVTE
jgi:hypothetical protein